MSKADLVEKIAKDADVSKAAAEKAVNSFMEGVTATLKKGGTVTLIGFGTFSVGKRAARTGRNPKTGAPLKIKAKKVARFKPGSALKTAVNK
ncbi:MAG: HU family DNA-binding protein [Chloroherpetonaceae bacterium]|nr:HU family DNA-binding protein [Chloroherpetonaceae bacterium]